ncbi:MAG: hypothetical protein AAF488_13135 [Planctomycetota bacterium]
MKKKIRSFVLWGLGTVTIASICLAFAHPDLNRWIREQFISAEELLAETEFVSQHTLSPERVSERLHPLTTKKTPSKAGHTDFDIRLGSRPSIQVGTYSESALLVSRDGRRLLFADYFPSRQGCALEAYDLHTGKRIWRTELKGNPVVNHSFYRNSVLIRQDHHRFITVFGNESSGQYTEIVDIKTGETKARRNSPAPALPQIRTRTYRVLMRPNTPRLASY